MQLRIRYEYTRKAAPAHLPAGLTRDRHPLKHRGSGGGVPVRRPGARGADRRYRRRWSAARAPGRRMGRRFAGGPRQREAARAGATVFCAECVVTMCMKYMKDI